MSALQRIGNGPGLVLILAAALLCGAAVRAQENGSAVAAASQPQPRILVLQLEDRTGDAELTRRVNEMLRGELVGLLGEQLAAPDPDAEAPVYQPCEGESALDCARKRAGVAAAGKVVGGIVTKDVERLSVEIWVFDFDHSDELRSMHDHLEADPSEWPIVLRELAVRLAAPQHHVGVLEVVDVQIFDRLLVDGAAIPIDVPTTRLTLDVGPHAVDLERAGKPLLNEVVEIAYDRVTRFPPGVAEQVAAASSLPAQEAPQTEGAQPTPEVEPPWLAYGALGVGAVGLAAAAGFLAHYFLYARPDVEWAAQQEELGSECRDGSADCWSRWSAQAETTAALDLVAGIGGGLIGLVAVGTGIWLLVDGGEIDAEVSAGGG